MLGGSADPPDPPLTTPLQVFIKTPKQSLLSLSTFFLLKSKATFDKKIGKNHHRMSGATVSFSELIVYIIDL